MKVKSLSRVRLLATLWTIAYQAPPSMEFSRQEYWRHLDIMTHIYVFRGAAGEVFPLHNVELSWEVPVQLGTLFSSLLTSN